MLQDTVKYFLSAGSHKVTVELDGGTIGEHKLTVKFSNGFSGTKTIKYTVVPLGTKVTYVTGESKLLKVEFAEQTTETSFYEVQVCKNPDFKSGIL